MSQIDRQLARLARQNLDSALGAIGFLRRQREHDSALISRRWAPTIGQIVDCPGPGNTYLRGGAVEGLGPAERPNGSRLAWEGEVLVRWPHQDATDDPCALDSGHLVPAPMA
jgi:hypothetical protein